MSDSFPSFHKIISVEREMPLYSQPIVHFYLPFLCLVPIFSNESCYTALELKVILQYHWMQPATNIIIAFQPFQWRSRKSKAGLGLQIRL